VVAVLALLAAAVPVMLLPATGRDVPAEALRAGQEALQRALPPPFEAAKLDLPVFEEHLAAAGTGCRADPACVCASAPLEAGARALDLDLVRLSARAWAADLRLIAPCENEVIDRRAAVVDASQAALTRFVAGAAVALLRGRDRAAPRPAPLDAAALIARGRARLDEPHLAAALQDFVRAHELAPTLAFPLYGMAEARRRMGERPAAIQLFEEFLRADGAADSTAELRKGAAQWIEALRKETPPQ
jgi:hypothetical protein